MSDETRRAMDYIVRALAASVRDGQRELLSDTPVYSVGVILRRMRSDIGALAALLRETQKDAPVRRKRRKRKEQGGVTTPLADLVESSKVRALRSDLATLAKARAPRTPRRIVVTPEPSVRTPPGVSE